LLLPFIPLSILILQHLLFAFLQSILPPQVMLQIQSPKHQGALCLLLFRISVSPEWVALALDLHTTINSSLTPSLVCFSSIYTPPQVMLQIQSSKHQGALCLLLFRISVSPGGVTIALDLHTTINSSLTPSLVCFSSIYTPPR
jgi:succinylglutamate desuccinylase